MPSLTTPDGQPVETGNATVTDPAADRDEINRQFSRAMATEKPGETAAPPRLDDKPAETPKRPRGRPRKTADERPRVTDKPPEAPAPKVDRDYTDECAGLSTLGWAALAATPWTSPYACVVEANQEQLVKALNGGCQQNPRIREAVERWSAGGGGVYMLQLAAVGTNMGVQAMQLLKDPALRAEARAHTEGKFREFLKAQGVNLPGEAEETVSNVNSSAPEAADVADAA